MLHRIFRKISRLVSQPQTNSQSTMDNSEPLSRSIQVNLSRITNLFSDASDIVIREFQIGTFEPTKAFLVFVDGLVDKTMIGEDIMKPLMLELGWSQPGPQIETRNVFTLVKERVLAVGEVKEANTLEEVVDAVLSGDAVLFLDGFATALAAGTRAWESRGVEEPETEAVVRGPREGFTETLRINTALLRRKIKNLNLKFDVLKIGRQTKTDVCIAYIKGIANDKIVEEVKRRLNRIDMDSILESGYIEQLIEDAPFSFLPTVGNTEKPDVVAAKILEGRVAIITDGTPFVLTVPYLFIEALQVSEDYYSRPFYATLVRWVRFVAFLITVFAPAVYVFVTTFHQEMIPPALLVTMAAAREGTPFPAVVEALLMGIIFEILREAGVRLPRPVGQAVSIVGALVIGEAAVSAGLIGAPMVMIIAVTAIASFVTPTIIDAVTLMRFFLTILAGIFGQFGVALGVVGLLTHMLSLRSFGAPYLSPLAPSTVKDLKDVFIRAPWWAMFTRPRVIGWKDPVRQRFWMMPEPPEDEEEKST